MKLVWKCDHCSSADVDRSKIEEHEITCVFNPFNRHCYTCDNKYNYYESDLCKVHYNGWPSNTDNPHIFFEAQEGNIICKDWTNAEIRSKKLKKIIKKIDITS